MQIGSLKVFCDLVETQSFTKAAQVNGVTQSAVSQQVSALETRFQSKLVERSKKRFRLTREGEMLYEFSKKIVGLFDALHVELQEVREVVSGTIRVAAIYSIGLYDLPPFIKRLLQGQPTVKVQVEYRHAEQVYEDVLGSAADLGLVAYPRRESRLEIVPLRDEPLVLICHSEHSFAKLKSIKIRALEGQKFVSFEPDMPTRRALDRLFRAHHVTVQHALEFDNVETVKRAVEIDAGLAIVPLSTVTQEVAKRTLAAVTIEKLDIRRPLAAVYRKNRTFSPAMEQFITLLKQPL